MLRTFGIPILSLARSARSGFCPCPPEGLRSNHFAKIGKFTALLLHLGFHRPHLVCVLHQALGAGVAADDALPALLERYLAPRASFGVVKFHVDESAFTVHGAPAADGVLAGGAAVFERFNQVETAEAARSTIGVRIDGTKRRANGTRLA